MTERHAIGPDVACRFRLAESAHCGAGSDHLNCENPFDNRSKDLWVVEYTLFILGQSVPQPNHNQDRLNTPW